MHPQETHIEICRCQSLKLTTEVYVAADLASFGNTPVLVYDEGLWKRILRLNPDLVMIKPLFVGELVRNCLPTLMSHELDGSISTGLPAALTNPSQRVCAAFIRCIETIARLEPRPLGELGRLLFQCNHPVARLVHAIQKHLIDGPPIRTVFDDVSLPPMPSNVIGHSIVQDAGEEGQFMSDHAVRDVFDEGGHLSRHLAGFEVRLAQIELADEIGRAFNEGKCILAEAGTGTGKSLAYLVPSILWARKNDSAGEQVVVSTHTKNLQDQLFFKDIPQLLKALPVDFRAVLVKGRNNYVCMRKWKGLLADPSHWSAEDREKLIPIWFWLRKTTTGDIAECHGFSLEDHRAVWNRIASESGYCQAQKCNVSDDCFVKRMRDEISSSHLAVVNHSLLFSDLLSDRAILGPYRNLIIDEAHHLEKTAQQYLGVEFSLRSLRSILNSLYEKDRSESGVLSELKRFVEKVANPGNSYGVLTQGIGLVGRLNETATTTFQKWASTFRGTGSVRQRYGGDQSPMLGDDGLKGIRGDATELLGLLATIITSMDMWSTEDREMANEFRQTVSVRMEEMMLLMETAAFLADASDDNYVYWYEVSGRASDIRFYAVPLNIADILEDRLLSNLRTCVFSSATLSVAGSFDYYKRRVGLDRLPRHRVLTFSALSPFDFDRNCRLIIPSYVPEPNAPNFEKVCADIILTAVLSTRRSSMVLFTSYALLESCYSLTREAFADAGISCFGQGIDGSRTWLTEQFKSNRGSVLFGTDSFWEGVDVPGEALEILIITKLPFEVPSDPLVAAKLQKIEEAGGKPFFDYSVPEAVIRLRQGFGRLIRTQSDRGVVLILDKRTIQKSYGSIFLESLPVRPHVLDRPEELGDLLTNFFPAWK